MKQCCFMGTNEGFFWGVDLREAPSMYLRSGFMTRNATEWKPLCPRKTLLLCCDVVRVDTDPHGTCRPAGLLWKDARSMLLGPANAIRPQPAETP